MAFHFELVSPEKILFKDDVESVVIPAADGEMTILEKHAPVMTALRPGVVTVAQSGGKTRRMFVRGGFADVNPAGFTLLAEQSLPLEELDAAALDREIQNASEDVADAKEQDAKVRAATRLSQLQELKSALKM